MNSATKYYSKNRNPQREYWQFFGDFFKTAIGNSRVLRGFFEAEVYSTGDRVRGASGCEGLALKPVGVESLGH